LAATRAELSERAVVLYQLHSSGSARVTAYCPRLSRAAAAVWQDLPGVAKTGCPHSRWSAGIRPGMPLAEATALASFARAAGRGKAASLHLEMADPFADRAALVRLAEWCQRFSPSVGLEEAEAAECLLLDVTGLGRLLGGEDKLLEQVVRDFQARGLTVRVALADTPSAAWAMAHFTPLEGALGGELADASTDEAILAALARGVLVRPGETAAALGPLPVAALDLPAEIETLLAELGLERIEQVAALPRSTLLARFGNVLLDQLDRSQGIAPTAIVAQAPPVELRFEQWLEHPTARGEIIEHVLGQLVEQACAALLRQRRGMLRLECQLAFEGRPALVLVVGFYRPSANVRHVRELVGLQLESRRLAAPVAAIELRVLAYDELEFHQQQMFDTATPRQAPRELTLLVDRLSNRLGSHAVVRPWLLPSAQPEFACQYRPWASLATRPKKPAAKARRPRPAKTMSARAEPPATAGAPVVAGPAAPANAEQAGLATLVPGDRPLRLEPRPRRLIGASVAPEGPPVQFRLAGIDQQVVRYWGPERIETSWWRGCCVRRDYYQAEMASGDRYWLFRELTSGHWFLHGYFA
jgi:protein ImuB